MLKARTVDCPRPSGDGTVIYNSAFAVAQGLCAYIVISDWPSKIPVAVVVGVPSD